MGRVISLLLIILAVWASAPAAQKEQPGPTLEKAADMQFLAKYQPLGYGREWREEDGFTSSEIFECPKCHCVIINHTFICSEPGQSTWFDCYTHAFEPCKFLEVISSASEIGAVSEFNQFVKHPESGIGEAQVCQVFESFSLGFIKGEGLIWRYPVRGL